MSSQFEQIVSAVKTALSGINGTSPYVTNFSDEGQVEIGGGISQTGQQAQIAIGAPSLKTSRDELTSYTRTAMIPVVARCPASENSQDERLLQAIRTASDIATAIEANSALWALCLEIDVETDTYTGEEVGWSAGAVTAVVKVKWISTPGSGF